MNGPSKPSLSFKEASTVVKAALACGVSYEDIPQHLVARGMNLDEATDTVNAVLENRIRSQIDSHETAGDTILVHRIVSGIILLACLGLAYLFGGGGSTMYVMLPATGATLCIWFPEWMADRTDESYTPFIRWGGWLVLVAILVYRAFLLTLVL